MSRKLIAMICKKHQVIARKVYQHGSGNIMKYLLMLFALLVVVALIHQTQAEDHDCTKNAELCKPEQIHIAFGEKINDITVTWSTLGDPKEALLKYGEGNLDKTVNGETKLFVDGGSEQHSQWIHNVWLKNLKYNATYVYSVGSNFGWSDQISFKTPPAGESEPISVVVFGDLGYTDSHSLRSIFDDVKSGHYAFSLHVGDFAYDLDSYQGKLGDKFMNMVQPFASILPYMVCVGNHESEYNYSHYRNRFSMPGNTDSMYYSFDIGPIHFIALNTETYYNNTHYPGRVYPDYEHEAMVAQYEWLQNDLKEANKTENRQKRPWIITYGHRPFYCTNNHDPNDKCRDNDDKNSDTYYVHRNGIYGLEPLLYEYRVNLEIWAHEHSYERMWPVYNHTVYNGSYEHPYVNPGAPVQITTGSAGCKESRDTFYCDPYAWSAFRSSDYGYTRLTVHNKTHLYVEELSTLPNDNEKVTTTATEDYPKKIDEFWLIKDSK